MKVSWMNVLAGSLMAAGVAGGLCGCVMGPVALRVSRARYNEVIRETENEQLLLNLVRLKYRDTPLFLEVGSLSAQFVFGQSADLVGVIAEGPSRVNPNRLDLKAGFDYQERPTITFTPLAGKEFVMEMLSPLQPHVLVLLSRSGWSVDRVLRLTVQGINGVDNASSASGPTPQQAPEFQEFARVSRLFRELQRKGLLVLDFVTRRTDLDFPLSVETVNLSDILDADGRGYGVRLAENGKSLIVSGTSQILVWRVPPPAERSPEVEEIIEILGLAPGQTQYEIRPGNGCSLTSTSENPRHTHITVSMRSLMGALFYLSQAVEVPPRHSDMKLVTTTLDSESQTFDWTLVTGELLRVHSQRNRPSGTAVAVKYRGHWYYIDDTDLRSKSTFGLLGQLFALQAGGVDSVAPVLTLPLGG